MGPALVDLGKPEGVGWCRSLLVHVGGGQGVNDGDIHEGELPAQLEDVRASAIVKTRFAKVRFKPVVY